MKQLCIFIFYFFVLSTCYAQSKYIDSLKSELEATTAPIKRFELLQKMSRDNFITGRGNVDSFACIEMYRIASSLNNDSLLAMSHNWTGDYFLFSKGDNITALEYLFKGIAFAEKANDKHSLSSLYLDIALAYFNLDNPDEAIKNIRRAGENLPGRSEPFYDYMVRQYQSAISNYFIMKHQPDSALYFIQALNETNMRLKSGVFESRAQILSAQVYEQLGDEKLADIYYRMANTLADSMQFSNTKLIIKKKYTLYLIRKGNIEDAKQQAWQLLGIGAETGNTAMELAGAGFLRQVYDTLNMEDSAFYYSEKELALKDAAMSQNNLNKIQSLSFNEQLRVMEVSAEKAEAEEQRKLNIEYVLITFFLVLGMLIFLLLSRSTITSSKLITFLGAGALLIVFEFFTLLLTPFLKSITHESPALMLLAYVIIAALLVPAHHRLEKWMLAKLVEKNRRIRLENARKTIIALSGDEDKNY